MHAPKHKRLVDLVDRGPEDDVFYPPTSDTTLFRRDWAPYHNVVNEIADIGYQGSAAWGQRITVKLTRQDSGDLLQWVCLRFKPCSWLGPALENKINSGVWDYADKAGAWMWANSLGTAAIARVELEIGDAPIESWPGEWMDIWSRNWLDLGRAPGWDADLYGKLPTWVQNDANRPPWTTITPTEDGYVYSWLPLTFLRRPQTAFPLAAMGSQEVRLHITFRPFTEVVRRRTMGRRNPFETPLGETIVLNDITGQTPIPYEYTLPTKVPEIQEATVFVGVVQTENPLRSAYMRIPIEMMYEPVSHMVFDVAPGASTVALRLDAFNGPIRELIFFIRQKDIWMYNDWTNYGALLDPELAISEGLNADAVTPRPIATQEPLLVSARLTVGNAIWRDETEKWWRIDHGLKHRGGVRATSGMVYGYMFGESFEDLQPAGTVNASRAEIRLDLQLAAPQPRLAVGCILPVSNWEIYVFAVGLNWLRFVNGLAVPLFKD